MQMQSFEILICVISFIHQVFGFLASLCTILTICNYFWEVREGSVFTAFLPREPGADVALSAFFTFWSYVIVLNTLVPLSLYIRYVLSGKESNRSYWEFRVRVRPCVCQCQYGGHPSGEQLLHRLGQEDVLPQE